LEELFSKYGELRNITIMHDRETGLPRGIAFVNFIEDGPAEKAIAELDGE
jgi:translation initiation factor 3 subunit G